MGLIDDTTVGDPRNNVIVPSGPDGNALAVDDTAVRATQHDATQIVPILVSVINAARVGNKRLVAVDGERNSETLAVEMLADSGMLLSMDLVEVNPILDERNKTGQLASDLIQLALGKKFY